MLEESRNISTILLFLIRDIKDEVLITNFKEDIKTGKAYILALIFLLSLSISVPFGFRGDVPNLFSQVVDAATSIYVAFTAMLLGAYAIIHSLTDTTVVRLLSSSKDAGSLKENARIYLKYIVMFFIGTALSFILSTILILMPDDFLLFPNQAVSTVIAVFGIYLYFFYLFVCFYAAIKFTISIYKFYCFHNKVIADDDK